MAVVSDDINLSINFLNCKSGEILDLYFQHNLILDLAIHNFVFYNVKKGFFY